MKTLTLRRTLTKTLTGWCYGNRLAICDAGLNMITRYELSHVAPGSKLRISITPNCRGIKKPIRAYGLDLTRCGDRVRWSTESLRHCRLHMAEFAEGLVLKYFGRWLRADAPKKFWLTAEPVKQPTKRKET